MLAVLGKGVKWRVFEKEMLEKHFGPVSDTPLGTPTEGEPIFWKLHTENTTARELQWCLENQTKGFVINSPACWMAAHSKLEALEQWRDAQVPVPDFFEFDALCRFRENPIRPPYLIRVDTECSGRGSFYAANGRNAEAVASLVLNMRAPGISQRKFCIRYIDCDRPYNYSYRIIVSAGKVIAGYARVCPKTEWIAIAGKFSPELKDAWVQCNQECYLFCQMHESLIVKAVETLGMNFVGVDVVLDGFGHPYFLEVQPNFSAGYADPEHGFIPPYYNPSYPELVKFLVENKKELWKKIPWYYENWLDKENLFDLCFKELKWLSTATLTVH